MNCFETETPEKHCKADRTLRIRIKFEEIHRRIIEPGGQDDCFPGSFYICR